MHLLSALRQEVVAHENAIESKIPEKRATAHFRVAPFQTEAKCKTIHLDISFIFI